MANTDDPGLPTVDTLLDDLATLVAVESPSGDLDAVDRSATAVADLGERRLGVAGKVVVVDGVSHVRWRLGDGPRRVLLLGHHDTVWPLGTLASMPFRVEDGVVRGPGCFDMKGGIVLALHAVATVVARHGAAGVDGTTILVTGDEEIGSTTSRALIEDEARACSAVLVTEPGLADGSIKVGRKGASVYRMVAHGHATHAGLEPEAGVNATVELATQVPLIAALGAPDLETTVTPTVLRGGTSDNTVPERAEVVVDVRATSASEQDRVDRDLHALGATLPGARLEVLGGVNRPPLARALADPLADVVDEVCDNLGQQRPARRSVGGASDGNFTAGMGIPTLDGLGATGGGAHARDEHVLADGLVPRHRMLAGLLESLVVDGRPVGPSTTDAVAAGTVGTSATGDVGS